MYVDMQYYILKKILGTWKYPNYIENMPKNYLYVGNGNIKNHLKEGSFQNIWLYKNKI